MSVSDRWTPEGEALMRELRELQGLEIFVGFQRGAKQRNRERARFSKDSAGNLTAGKVKRTRDKEGKLKEGAKEVDVLDIAAWNELGTSRGIPERPFIRQTADNNQDELFDSLEEAAQRVESGGTAQGAADHVGVKVKAIMQREIKQGNFKANSPITIAMKGSDVPLIDTGQMRQSVHFVVRKKGSGEE